jgi:hypothetical protein
MRFTNDVEATGLLKPDYRRGWIFSWDDEVEFARRVGNALPLGGVLKEIPYQPARLWDRVCAFPLDLQGVTFEAMFLALGLLVPMAIWMELRRWTESESEALVDHVVPFLFCMIPVFLILADVGCAAAGLGKQERKIRLLSADHKPVTRTRAAARALSKIVIAVLPAAALRYLGGVDWTSSVVSLLATVWNARPALLRWVDRHGNESRETGYCFSNTNVPVNGLPSASIPLVVNLIALPSLDTTVHPWRGMECRPSCVHQ